MQNIKRNPENKAVQANGTAALIRAAGMAAVPLISKGRSGGLRDTMWDRCMLYRTEAA